MYTKECNAVVGDAINKINNDVAVINRWKRTDKLFYFFVFLVVLFAIVFKYYKTNIEQFYVHNA